MRFFKGFLVLAIAGAGVFGSWMTFTQADAHTSFDTDMLLGHSTIEVPVRVTVPQGGLSEVVLMASAEGAEMVDCFGPVYTEFDCASGLTKASISVVDVNHLWNLPGHVDWVATFRLKRIAPGTGTIKLNIEAIRAVDDNGNPVTIEPMTVTIQIQ